MQIARCMQFLRKWVSLVSGWGREHHKWASYFVTLMSWTCYVLLTICVMARTQDQVWDAFKTPLQLYSNLKNCRLGWPQTLGNDIYSLWINKGVLVEPRNVELCMTSLTVPYIPLGTEGWDINGHDRDMLRNFTGHSLPIHPLELKCWMDRCVVLMDNMEWLLLCHPPLGNREFLITITLL